MGNFSEQIWGEPRGGVIGTLRRVPFGIHSSTRSSVSSTTNSGRAAHSRPPHTSLWMTTWPRLHIGTSCHPDDGSSRPSWLRAPLDAADVAFVVGGVAALRQVDEYEHVVEGVGDDRDSPDGDVEGSRDHRSAGTFDGSSRIVC